MVLTDDNYHDGVRNFLEAYRRSRRVFWSRKIIIIIII